MRGTGTLNIDAAQGEDRPGIQEAVLPALPPVSGSGEECQGSDHEGEGCHDLPFVREADADSGEKGA